MHHRTRIVLFLLSLCCALLPVNALACSPAQQSVRVLCTHRSHFQAQSICFGSDCSLQFKDEISGTQVLSTHLQNSVYITDRFGIVFLPLRTSQHEDALRVIQLICVEDFTSILAPLLHAIDRWTRTDQHQPGNGDFILQPYTETKEQALHQDSSAYRACQYPAYTRLGDWLVSKQITRPYCVESRRPNVPCPTIELSIGAFLLFLLYHADRSTILYVAIMVFGSALLFGACVLRYRQRGWRAFQPTLWTLGLSLVGTGLSTFVSGFANMLFYFGIIYLFLCLIRPMRDLRRL
jgi:hypothetical protein